MSADMRADFCSYLEGRRPAVEGAAREILERAREIRAVQGGEAVWEALDPFPLVLSAGELEAARGIAESASRAMAAAASCTDGELREACGRLGLEREVIDLVVALRPVNRGWWSRIDLMPAEDSWRIVEVNVGGGMGGCHIADLFELQLADRTFAEYLDGKGLRFDDPTAAYVRELHALWRTSPAGSVAFVDWPGYLSECEVFLGRFAERLTAEGAPAVVCELSDLAFSGGALQGPDGSPVAAVVANYLLEDLQQGLAPLAPVAQAAAARMAFLVMAPHGEVFGSKLAPGDLLSRASTRRLLSPEEVARLERATPATRLLHDLSPRARDELVRRRSRYVLKPVIGSQGQGVVIGSRVTEAQWRDQLEEARRRPQPSVVQDRIDARPWTVPWLTDQGTLERVDAVVQLSVFTLETKAVGSSARVMPGTTPGLMSTLRGAALASVASPVSWRVDRKPDRDALPGNGEGALRAAF